MNFEFATAGRIVFGPGTLAQAGPAAAALGRRALVVTGRSTARAQPLLDLLTQQEVAFALFPVDGEPTVDAVLDGAAQARGAGCDLVVGFGGGSAVDAAKAIAAFLTNPGDPYDYLEVIGRAQPLSNPPAPVLAIPTTAGTGAEVTRNAVLTATAQKVKVSVRSPLMLPRVAIVDPLLTHGVPPEVTAATGLDALTQLIEPFVSVRATPLTDALCREALPRAARSLRRACEQGDDAAAREEMAFASLCGGLALANAGLGAVHGVAGPFGGMFAAPHGATCAALLAPLTEATVRALRARAPDAPALARYAEAARICTGLEQATPDDLVVWLRELVRALHVPPLREYGFGADDIETLLPKAQRSSSMKGNPIALTDAELAAALLTA